MSHIKDKFPEKPATYIIQDPVSGKAYIGSTKNLNKRMYVHRTELNTNTHNNQELQEAFSNNKDLEVSAIFLKIRKPL